MLNKIILFVVNQYSVIMQRNCPWLLVTSHFSSSSESSLPNTPEDGPSAPSATVTKKENIMIKPLNLKLLCLLKNLVTERLKGIDRALE